MNCLTKVAAEMRRGELVSKLCDLIDEYSVDEIAWALGVVKEDIASALADIASAAPTEPAPRDETEDDDMWRAEMAEANRGWSSDPSRGGDPR